jgi:hypothetical protein
MNRSETNGKNHGSEEQNLEGILSAKMPFFGSDMTSLFHPSFTEITSLHILGKIESKFLLGEFFPIW